MDDLSHVDVAALPWLRNYRVATWWTGDNTMFDWSDEEFDRQAWTFKQQGYTACDPSGFHFRWSWMEADKANLLQMTRRIVEALHRYGLKHMEHHSAVVMHRPPNEEAIHRFLTVEGTWNRVDYDRHPLFVEGLRRGVIYQGQNLDELAQRDLATGNFAGTGRYNGIALCPNNPIYRKLYFGYLEELYDLGIDGILPDDVMFFPGVNSCGCAYCREKFKRATGHTLPDNPETVRTFLGDYQDPVYRAWLEFRLSSTADFHREVTKHFRSRGRNLARPIYCSCDTTTLCTVRAYSVERLAPHCSLVFTEVFSAIVLPHSWERVGVEALHRRAIACRYGLPAQIEFYPREAEAGSFCLAFAALLGQGYLGFTYHAEPGQPKTAFDQIFDLIKSQAELFEMPRSMARVKVFFSRFNRDFYLGHDDRHAVWEWAGWCELLLRERIPFDVILHEDLEENAWLRNTDLLILPNAACMTPTQAEQVRCFVAAGGKLIATHESSLYDTQGTILADFQLGDVFGLRFVRTETRTHPNFLPMAAARAGGFPAYFENTEPVVLARPMPDVEILAKVLFDFDMPQETFPAIARRRYGDGEVVVFLGKPGNQNYADFIYTDVLNIEAPWRCVGRREPAMRQVMLQTIRDMIRGRETLIVEGAPDSVLASCFRTEGHVVVHLLNATGVCPEPGATFTNGYPPTTFPLVRVPMNVSVRCNARAARAYAPNRSEPAPLPVRREDGLACFEVPAGTLEWYLAVDLME